MKTTKDLAAPEYCRVSCGYVDKPELPMGVIVADKSEELLNVY
jgi:hypothetical protein